VKHSARFASSVVSAGLLGAALVSARFTAPGFGPQATVSAQRIPALTLEQQEILGHMSIVYLDDGQGGQVKTLRLSDINFQVVNGLGTTDTANGVGNLIVGYNEPGSPFGDDRTGSHNIVAGFKNSFTSHGGLVVGERNQVSAPWASVSGGSFNRASGVSASVSGGSCNLAYGARASVSGGICNKAYGAYSSVSGGYSNVTAGSSCSISGGAMNYAVTDSASVSGGYYNTASGFRSSASGGYGTVASGTFSWGAGTFAYP